MSHHGGQWESHGLALLFPRGEAPDLGTLEACAQASDAFAVSHIPPQQDRERPHWAELLIDGLTFDIEGFAPGLPVHVPEIAFRFDCHNILEPSQLTALRLVPGPHLSGGERSMPVVRMMLRLACEISSGWPGLVAMGWTPARSMIGPEYFRSIIGAWLDGGPFPALGVTAFKAMTDGALQSEGLDFFTGQELRIEPELAQDKAEATRLAVRLVNQLVPLGRLDGPEIVTAPDGSILRLAPSANGRFVRVRGS